MSKPLCHLRGDELTKAISRRIAGNTRGLGYWSAVEAMVILMPRKIAKDLQVRVSEPTDDR